MTSTVNLTPEIPAATNTELNPPPTEDIPFSGTNAVIDMMEDAPFPCSGNDSETGKTDNSNGSGDKKNNEFDGGRDVTGLRPDVRHASHYYNNANKAGEHNHISTPGRNKLSEIVQLTDIIFVNFGQTKRLLDELQTLIRDFANSN